MKINIKEGSIINETVDFNRFSNCGYGINVATSDGKIRCERVKLLEKVESLEVRTEKCSIGYETTFTFN